MTKAYARELQRKIRTGTKKKVFLALVTPHSLKPNAWAEDLVTNVVTVDELFREGRSSALAADGVAVDHHRGRATAPQEGRTYGVP